MTGTIVAVLDRRTPNVHIAEVAASIGRLLDADVTTLLLAATPDTAAAAHHVLAALRAPESVGAVIAAEEDATSLGWQVAVAAEKPIVLVPASARAPRRDISRALLPLDGTRESAEAVAETARLLDHAGVELVVLHVFSDATVPRFWDQRAHAQSAWSREFLHRQNTPASARLEIRNGVPGMHVARAADLEDVDLIALGWSPNADRGHARTVHESVTSAHVPIMLVPISRS